MADVSATAAKMIVGYRAYCRLRAEERRAQTRGAAGRGGVLFCRAEFRDRDLEMRPWVLNGP